MRNALLATAIAAASFAAPAMAMAFEAGDFVVRARGIVVAPLDDDDGVVTTANGVNTGASVEPSLAVMPELDFTYMITDNIGVELIAAVTPHDFESNGGVVGAALAGDIAEGWLLPPTLSLQYHFDTGTAFKPYLGAGLNVTIPFALSATDRLETVLGGPTDVKADASVGYSLQAGVDYMIDDSLMVNLDIKYIDIDTTVETFNAVTGVQTTSTELQVDPIVIGFGVGYKF